MLDLGIWKPMTGHDSSDTDHRAKEGYHRKPDCGSTFFIFKPQYELLSTDPEPRTVFLLQAEEKLIQWSGLQLAPVCNQ